MPSTACLLGLAVLAWSSCGAHGQPQEQLFFVDNSELQAASPGLGWRTARDLDSKDGSMVPWGTIVKGVLDGKDWIQAGGRFLPVAFAGKQVIRAGAAVAGARLQSKDVALVRGEPTVSAGAVASGGEAPRKRLQKKAAMQLSSGGAVGKASQQGGSLGEVGAGAEDNAAAQPQQEASTSEDLEEQNDGLDIGGTKLWTEPGGGLSKHALQEEAPPTQAPPEQAPAAVAEAPPARAQSTASTAQAQDSTTQTGDSAAPTREEDEEEEEGERDPKSAVEQTLKVDQWAQQSLDAALTLMKEPGRAAETARQTLQGALESAALREELAAVRKDNALLRQENADLQRGPRRGGGHASHPLSNFA